MLSHQVGKSPISISGYSSPLSCNSFSQTPSRHFHQPKRQQQKPQTPPLLPSLSQAAERDKTLESGGRRVAPRSGGARPRPLPTLTTRIASRTGHPRPPPTPHTPLCDPSAALIGHAQHFQMVGCLFFPLSPDIPDIQVVGGQSSCDCFLACIPLTAISSWLGWAGCVAGSGSGTR